MADPIQDEIRRRGMWDMVDEAFHPKDEPDFRDSRVVQIYKNSLIGDLVRQVQGGPVSDWQKIMSDETLRKRDKAAYALARVAQDFVTDGSRTPYWLLNHPLAATAVQAEMATTAAGLAPNYRKMAEEMQVEGGPQVTRQQVDARFARQMGFRHPANPDHRVGIPMGLAGGALPALIGSMVVGASGNHDLLNLAQGGRTRGYAAVLPTAGSLTETSNAPMELILRYFAGRSGRLLPWEQFTQERPDVSPQDYAGARRDQFDRGPLGVGLFKATSRNLEGEPEFSMMGFRVPLSAAATGGGAMIGAIGGAGIADKAIHEHLRKKHGDAVLERPPEHNLSLRAKGNRRLLGAVLGGLGGGLAGRTTSNVVNDTVLQPMMHPDRVAAEKQWLAGAAGRTLEERVKALEPERLTPGEEVPDLQRRQQNQQQIQQQMLPTQA